MNDATRSTDAPKRWPRGQKFAILPEGRAARSALAEAVAAARVETGGRAAQDAAMAGWAQQHRVKPGDGSVLDELDGRERNLSDLATALEPCGVTRAEAQAAVDRLVTASLVVAVQKPDAPPSTPPVGTRTPFGRP